MLEREHYSNNKSGGKNWGQTKLLALMRELLSAYLFLQSALFHEKCNTHEGCCEMTERKDSMSLSSLENKAFNPLVPIPRC